jgi:hypothetical protein
MHMDARTNNILRTGSPVQNSFLLSSMNKPDEQSDHVPILDFSTYSFNSIANHLRSQIILAEIKEIK